MELIRGDTHLFKVKLKNITLEEIDTVFITCRKDIYSKDYIFQKRIGDVTIDNNLYVHFAFDPVDTQTLPYGSYVFDIEVTLKSGYRKTKLFKFNLTGEATFHSNGGDA